MFQLNRKRSDSAKILAIIFIFILIINIFPFTSDLNQENNNEFPNSEQENNSGEYLAKKLDYSKPESRSTRAEPVDLIIHKETLREFKNDGVYKNITIRDDATMIIKDCEFIIKGSLSVLDNGRLFIFNSSVYIEPGHVDQQKIIINFLDNAYVQITDSNLYTHPQPSPSA